jgi:FdhD protein
LTFLVCPRTFPEHLEPGEILQSDPTKTVSVHAFSKGQFELRELTIIQEKPLTLYLDEKEIVTLLTDGQHPEELTAGFFHSEGFIDRAEDIRELSCDKERGTCRLSPSKSVEFQEDLHGRRLITTGCGKGSIYYHVLDAIAAGKVRIEDDFSIEPGKLSELAIQASRGSALYKDTHGVHTAALCSAEEILVSRDDIGRHNAIEKIVGYSLFNSVTPEKTMMFTTGRITSEVIIKVARLGCPILVSRSSASSLALELAEKTGITVVGGIRASGFHIYAGSHRVKGA